MLLLRGTGEGLPTDRWLVEVMWPREGRLLEDDVRAAMELGAAELLSNGITTTSEMYFFGDAVAEGAVAAGMRCVVAAPLIEASDFARFGSVDEQIANISAARDRWRGHHLIEVGVGPHSAYALSEDALTKVSALVAADPMLVHTHIAEQPGEGDEVTARTGLTVPAYLDRLGLLTSRTVAAHCVWVTPDDIDVFAARGVSVAHCPASNGRHASGIAPVLAMRSRGIRVGIATDGPASHDRLDMLDDMRTAIRLARIGAMDAAAMPAASALAMSTSEAADALGRPDLGRLVAGCRADMIALELDEPGFDPIFGPDELVNRVVWAGSPAAVRDVWVHGRQVVASRRCLTVDCDAARHEVTARALRLVG
jgi:5-methylthioadenosine/S-adenosylhomocysteine deaminase